MRAALRTAGLALAAVIAALAPAAGSPPPGAPSCHIFPADNVWNARVDGLPRAADSARLIRSIGLDAALHPDFSDQGRYGIPFNVVIARTPRLRVRFDYASESDRVRYPIPARPRIEGGGDRHLLMLDRDACRLYELYAARRTRRGGTPARERSGTCARIACDPPGGPAPTPPGCRSCRGSPATTR